MTLDEARTVITTMTYKPGWTLQVVDRPDGPTLRITQPDGDVEYAPLPIGLPHIDRFSLAYWVRGRIMVVEMCSVWAAFRVDGQTLNELIST